MPTIDHEKIIQGNRRSLAQAITLTESKLDNHRIRAQQLLEKILPHSGKSVRIGITGTPGVGKSTFIETFGLHLVNQGKKVAVLAVDPSSPITGGSILGDKTRMEILSQNNNAFIRPSPASGALGGVAQKTREAILLCEAASYDVILVETVGVGQSEYEVAAMVDFFLVLMLPNAGDELQGIKKGILELADAIVINKADGECKAMAQSSKQHYQNALRLVAHNTFWKPRVLTCSALENDNIGTVWNMIQEFQEKAQQSGIFNENRTRQNKQWMWALLHELMGMMLKNHPGASKACEEMEQRVVTGETTPYNAANAIIKAFGE